MLYVVYVLLSLALQSSLGISGNLNTVYMYINFKAL